MKQKNVLDHIFTVDDVLTPTHLKLLTDTVKATNFEWNYLPNTHSDHTFNPLISYFSLEPTPTLVLFRLIETQC
jgi:hypothetical protein